MAAPACTARRYIDMDECSLLRNLFATEELVPQLLFVHVEPI